MFKKWFSNTSIPSRQTIHFAGSELEIVEQAPEDEKAEIKVPTVHFYGKYTEGEKVALQENSISNIIYCPLLTDEEKIKASEELKDFSGFICYLPPASELDKNHRK
jgi:hypothetical protein